MLFAGDGLVVDQRQILAFLEGGVKSSDGNDSSGGFDAGCRPGIEGEADSVLVLDFLKVHGCSVIRVLVESDGGGGRGL